MPTNHPDDAAALAQVDAVLDRFATGPDDDMPTTITKRATIAAALYWMGEKQQAARFLEDVADAIRVEIAQERVNATNTGRTHSRALVTRVCARCGARFPIASLRSSAAYCGSPCRQAAYRARGKANPQE